MLIQRKLYLSYFIIISIFLLYGCATNKPQLKVEEKNPNTNINAVISQLSQQISSSMQEQNKRKVAVTNFPLLTGEWLKMIQL